MEIVIWGLMRFVAATAPLFRNTHTHMDVGFLLSRLEQREGIGISPQEKKKKIIISECAVHKYNTNS